MIDTNQTDMSQRTLPVFSALNHIISSVGNNWKVGARHGIPWLALITLFKIWSLWKTPADTVAFTLPDAIALIVGLVATSSIAVSWHRYILQDEPALSVPPFRMDRLVWQYLWRTLYITLICILPIVVAALMSDLLPILLPLWVAISLIFVSLLVRFSLSLVASAVGKSDFSIKNAFEITRGNMTRILGLLLVVATIELMLFLLLVLPMAATTTAPPAWIMPVTVLLSIPVQLVAILINTSMLTSLYGFFVERRNF